MALIGYPNINLIKDTIISQAIKLTLDAIRILQQQVLEPNSGTLSPDQRPKNLTRQDVGTLFFSIDFDRMYRWNGSTWEDAPGSPQRYSISFFPYTNPPITPGWLQCNGSSGNASTSNGTVTAVHAPYMSSLDTQVPWIRL